MLWRRILYGLQTALLSQAASGSLAAPLESRQAPAASPTISVPLVPTAVTGRHLHGSLLYCKDGPTEYLVSTSATGATDVIPTSLADCHAHDGKIMCHAPNGDELQISLVTQESESGHGHDVHHEDREHDHDHYHEHVHEQKPEHKHNHGHNYEHELEHEHEHEDDPDHDHDHDHDDGHSSHAKASAEAASSSKQNCHFHAGVEHCTGSAEEGHAPSCAKVDRDYNIPLRVGFLFAILVASAIGVLLPILAAAFVPPENIGFTLLRQFGTGIIVSTAFVHLFTHASLMFANECIGHLAYESTAAAILMAGLFIAFLVEYSGQRLAQWHRAKNSSGNAEALAAGQQQQQNKTGPVNIAVMESGIIFHSLLIGLTLVVSGDAFFITLAIVIAIHQLFEGLALGTRIATLGQQHPPAQLLGHGHGHNHGVIQVQEVKLAAPASPTTTNNNGSENGPPPAQASFTIPMSHKLALAGAFALVTPIGMAIGLGVLKQFNGNNPSTIIAIGTLDALSAGILVWVGLVEMWAPDWMMGGEMADAGVLRTALGLVALAGGMALMSFLGKWA
ncbi:hypothetical protein B0T19DRAFT_452130 [Cercophora scortea]|uniref:Zinc transporter n=1 Tax=Cercophora scortea TaxID=314031 RepID=A0AAE0J2D1_9PEZI|nr:hypothetical protein B0T19DRAFT_452130 [Cercophora scortea]